MKLLAFPFIRALVASGGRMEGKMGVRLEPYDASSRSEMVALIEQDNPAMTHFRSSRFYDQAIDYILEGDGALYFVVRDSESDEFLGECDVHDTREPEWEIGIKIVKAHWGEGVGYEALVDFLAEMRHRYGKSSLIAKVFPDSSASIGLFQKLGARPRRIELSEFMIDEDMAARFREAHPNLVDDTVVEMAELFGVEPAALLGNVLVFEVPTAQGEPVTPTSHSLNKGQGHASGSSSLENAMRVFAAEEALVALEGLQAGQSRERLADFIKRSIAEIRPGFGGNA